MFYEKYREDFHMSLKRSESEGQPRGIEGAFKGLGSQSKQEQEKEQDKTTMSDSNRTADENALRPEPPAPENPDSGVWQLAGGAGKEPTPSKPPSKKSSGGQGCARMPRSRPRTPSEPNSRHGRKPPGAAPTNLPRCWPTTSGCGCRQNFRLRQAAADLVPERRTLERRNHRLLHSLAPPGRDRWFSGAPTRCSSITTR